MPSKLWLTGDSEPFFLNDPPDVVMDRVEAAGGGRDFLRFDMLPYTQHEPSKPAYIRASHVNAVGPVDEREIAHIYDNPPDWLE